MGTWRFTVPFYFCVWKFLLKVYFYFIFFKRRVTLRFKQGFFDLGKNDWVPHWPWVEGSKTISWKIGRMCDQRVKAKEIESIRHPQDKKNKLYSKQKHVTISGCGRQGNWRVKCRLMPGPNSQVHGLSHYTLPYPRVVRKTSFLGLTRKCSHQRSFHLAWIELWQRPKAGGMPRAVCQGQRPRTR